MVMQKLTDSFKVGVGLIVMSPILFGFVNGIQAGNECGVFDVFVEGCTLTIVPYLFVIAGLILMFNALENRPSAEERRRREEEFR